MKEGSPIAEKTLDVILHYSMTAITDLIEQALAAIQKVHIWDHFGKSYSPKSLSGARQMDSIIELRACSFQLELVAVDPRLQMLLFDESELELSWREIFHAITRCESFSHCVTVNEGESSTYLIYDNVEDMILDIAFDLRGKIMVARVLSRDECDEKSNAVRRTVSKFLILVLQWIWGQCEASI